MPFTFQQLGNEAPYAKTVEGRFRFVCPHCGDLQAILNPRNNLAHCFACGRNINNIDLLIALGYPFRAAVVRLQQYLRLFHQQQAMPAPSAQPSGRTAHGPQPLREALALEFEQLARACSRPPSDAMSNR
jgi:predicted RNA-binding Zn-ribbon protein involved in translation (DUF1610 family)